MTWLHANKLHLKKHIVTCYGVTVFSIFPFCKPKHKKKINNQTAYKKRNFIFGGLLFTIWFGRGSGSWQKIDQRLEKGKELMAKHSRSLDRCCLSLVRSRTDVPTRAHIHTHTCTPAVPSLQHRRISTEWQETRTEWSGKDMMSATTNNKRCKGASFPKLFQKCKMGTKTLHFLLRAELSESALLQHPRQRALWTVTARAIRSIRTGESKYLIYKQEGGQRKTKLKCARV